MLKEALRVTAVAGCFAVACFGAPPQKCQNIPITITFESVGMRMYGDGQLLPGGEPKPYDAQIYCDQSWMVQLNLMANNQRKFTINLQPPAQVNPGFDVVELPVGVASEQKTANYMKITHFLDGYTPSTANTPGAQNSFNTKLAVSFTVGRQGYDLRYNYDPPDGDPITPTMINLPQLASLVNVVYTPGTSATEYWVVTPIPLTAGPNTEPRVCSLATLFSGRLNAGQFDVPFKITIRRR